LSRKYLSLVCVLSCFSAYARADEPIRAFWDGNTLYASCITRGNAASCDGYIAGVADTLEMTRTICIPPRVTSGQLVDVVIKFLKDNPESRHYAGASEATIALGRAFPCQK